MTLFELITKVVKTGIAWPDILPLVTRNAADRLGLIGKGRIRDGGDADFVLLNEEMEIDCVWSRGRLMVSDGDAVVRSDYE